MAEVPRIRPGGSNRSRGDGSDEGVPPVKWVRGQDHHKILSRLVRWELEDELEEVEERWKNWTHRRLIDSGLALFDLVGRPNGHMFGDPIIAFSARGGENLSWHKFSHGDIVIISRSRPWDEKIVEGVVLDRNRRRIRIVCAERPDGLRKGSWRIDRGANRVAHDRMQDALDMFHSTEGEGGTVLRELILANLHDIELSAAMKPDLGPMSRRPNPPALGVSNLNSSQMIAVEKALDSRLSLIQGPPGTGKTHTAVHILSEWAKRGAGPILACADSNVAVDNLVEGLLSQGIGVVRLGRPVKVREGLREVTLDALVDEHPDKEDVRELIAEAQSIRQGLGSLKGREKGLAHRDIKRNWNEVRRLEAQIVDDIIDRCEVLCTTCIGAGHPTLGRRRFPQILIDEATQATEPAGLVPIVRHVRQLVLIGDHRQLPATVTSLRAEDGGLARSMFERLIKAGLEPTMLEIQYRMHPVLRDFPGGRFYEGRLEDGITAADRPAPAGFMWPDWDSPMAFIPIDGVEKVDEEGSSKSNMDEAARVVTVVESMLLPGDLDCRDIGVITPYNGQVRLIDELFEAKGGRGPDGKFAGLEVKSVDGYQGREKEVIIFSAVRANENGEVGFLSDMRRLNVAITRARRGMVVLGHMNTLRHEPTWAAWLDWAQEMGLIAWHAVNE